VETEPLRIPESDIVPLDDIAPDIAGLRILFVNVFGITNSNGSWVMVDAGVPLSAGRIRRWAEEKYTWAPAAIVLTHGHFDHVGAVKDLAQEWNVPVYAHELEMPFLTGKQQYPPPDPSVGGGLMAIMSPMYPRGPIDISDRLRPVRDGGEISELPGWKWLHTPGHTVGHISLFRERDRALVLGDAFCTVKAESMLAIAGQRPEMHGPPSYYTPDWAHAKESVLKLAALEPLLVAPGHGQAMIGEDVPLQLRRLADNFDAIAKPHHGKYASKGEAAA